MIAPNVDRADPPNKGGYAGSHKTYVAGTLRYALPGLLAAMGWLLWGDFCFHLMESVFPSVLPLMLRQLEAPNWLIALLVTTIPNIFNATVCPFVSFWSDRHRGPRGRRIPFILYTIPFLCAFLTLIGITPALVAWLVKIGLVQNAVFLSLLLIGIFTVGFQVFNMFVASVFSYLFNDVIPQDFLGRFLSAFRLVGSLATATFWFFVFPKAETNFMLIFVGIAVLYGVVFTVVCYKVKEGEYPDPAPLDQAKGKIISGVKTFFKECYSELYFWWFYLFVAFAATAGTIGVFGIFLGKTIGLGLEQLGVVAGVVSVVSALLLLPCGYLSDKFHPIRTALFAISALAILSLQSLGFFFFKIPAEYVFTVYCIIAGLSVPALALFTASEMPLYFRILPRDRFGQFAAATALLRSVACLIGGLLGGVLLDVLRSSFASPDDVYFVLPIWTSGFQLLSAFCLWRLYREWKVRNLLEASTALNVVVSEFEN